MTHYERLLGRVPGFSRHGIRCDQAWTALRSDSQLHPVELLFEAVEGVVADLVPIAHLEDGLPGRGQGALVDLFVRRARGVLLFSPSAAWLRCAVSSWRTASAAGDESPSSVARAASSARLAREVRFPPDRIVVPEAQHTDQRLQRQTLKDERADDHRERRHEDEIPVGKLRAVMRQCEGRRQRDDSAHARPGDDQAARERRRLLPGPRRAKTEAAVLPEHDGRVQRHPDDPHHDHRHQDETGDAEVPRPRVGVEARENGPHLQADEHEREHVQQEDGRLPDRVGRHPHPRRSPGRRRPRDEDREAEHRQNGRQAQPIRQDPDAESEDELQDDGRRDVPHTARQLHDDPPEHGPGNDAAGDDQQQRRRQSPERERRQPHRSDGQSVDQESRRVVQEALAREDRQDPMRRPELLQDRDRRRGIGRRHDRSERDRRRPGHRRHDRPCDDGHRGRRQRDAHDRETRDGHPVVLEVPGRGVVRGIQKHRGDEDRERHFGIDRERRRARDEGEHGAAEREKRRIRRAHTARDRGEDDGHEQDGEERFEAGHREEDYRTRVPL